MNPNSCYTCNFNLGGNSRGMCSCPDRGATKEDMALSEITQTRENKNELKKMVCEYHKE